MVQHLCHCMCFFLKLIFFRIMMLLCPKELIIFLLILLFFTNTRVGNVATFLINFHWKDTGLIEFKTERKERQGENAVRQCYTVGRTLVNGMWLITCKSDITQPLTGELGSNYVC